MAISVSMQGWYIVSSVWSEYQYANIGRGGNSSFYATEFVITPDKLYSSITLRFNGGDTTGLDAEWGIGRPSSVYNEGTALTTGSSNSLTLTGNYPAGVPISVYVWSHINTFFHTRASNPSATGVEPAPVEDDGLARVYGNGAWNKYEPRIRTNGQWASYEPYVYYNGQWRKMV